MQSTPDTFTSHSQAGQDQWVYDTLGHLRDGFFVDLGCSHPFDINNTWALEQVGWKGLLIDSDTAAITQCMKLRSATAYATDLLSPHDFWSWCPPIIDYLSLDIDEGTFECLLRIPLATLRIRCATIEHDSYRLGNKMRDSIRLYMSACGYTLARPDVTHDDLPFEDWWVREDLLP